MPFLPGTVTSPDTLESETLGRSFRETEQRGKGFDDRSTKVRRGHRRGYHAQRAGGEPGAPSTPVARSLPTGPACPPSKCRPVPPSCRTMRQRLPYVNDCRGAPPGTRRRIAMSDREGLRRRKAKELEQELRSAALELFETKGFEATSVEDIAAAVNVSARTVFRHFPRKDDLLMVASAEELCLVRESLGRRPADEPHLRALRAALTEYAADLERRRETVMRGIAIIDASPSLQRRVAEELNVWADELVGELVRRDGVPEPELVHVATVLVALAAMSAAYRAWISGSPQPLPELLTRVFGEVSEQVTGLSSGEVERS